MHTTVVFFGIIFTTFAWSPPRELPQWEEYKLAHNKSYSAAEDAYRFQIFSANLKKIKEHNAQYAAGLKTYRMGVNQFADTTAKEYRSCLTLSVRSPPLKSRSLRIFKAPVNKKLPKRVDYRKQNAVNPVKSQGTCGSCWAFSAIGALESINFLKTGKLLSLSEQNLVDCSADYGNNGCDSGWMGFAYKYIQDNGIETEQNYPYEECDGECKFQKENSVLTIKGHTFVEHGSEKALQAAVATVGPVAATVDPSGWRHYSGGIFSTNGSYGLLSHAVVVVGYGSENGQDYWIVRNSWGPIWGESGYIRVARNKNNQLGIANWALYPNL